MQGGSKFISQTTMVKMVKIPLISFSNSEAFASELLEDIEGMLCY